MQLSVYYLPHYFSCKPGTTVLHTLSYCLPVVQLEGAVVDVALLLLEVGGEAAERAQHLGGRGDKARLTKKMFF